MRNDADPYISESTELEHLEPLRLLSGSIRSGPTRANHSVHISCVMRDHAESLLRSQLIRFRYMNWRNTKARGDCIFARRVAYPSWASSVLIAQYEHLEYPDHHGIMDTARRLHGNNEHRVHTHIYICIMYRIERYLRTDFMRILGVTMNIVYHGSVLSCISCAHVHSSQPCSSLRGNGSTGRPPPWRLPPPLSMTSRQLRNICELRRRGWAQRSTMTSSLKRTRPW